MADTPTRSELLARLSAVGFVPPADAAPWSRAARSAAFRAAVEAFAAAYWSLAPADRRERYNQLWEGRCGATAARLGLLDTGLDLDAPDENAADVVRTVLRRRPPPPPTPLPRTNAWYADDEAPFYDETPVTPDETDPAAWAHYDNHGARLSSVRDKAMRWTLVLGLAFVLLSCVVSWRGCRTHESNDLPPARGGTR